MKLLALIRERTERNSEAVIVTELAASCGLSAAEIEAAWRYLHEHRLIDRFRLPLSARINARGIEVLEEVRRRKPAVAAENFADPRLSGTTVRGYGRVDSAEGLDRAREVTKELDRLDAMLHEISDPELSAYSTQSLSIGTFLRSKEYIFSVLTEEMLAQEFKRELARRKDAADQERGQTRPEKGHAMKTKKPNRLEVCSWIAGIVAAVIALVALIVEFSKTGEHLPPRASLTSIGQRQESGTQIGQVTGPVTIYNAPLAPLSALPASPAIPVTKVCSGESTQTFSPDQPGVMQTDAKGHRVDLGDGGGGTRLEIWTIRWEAPAEVISVKCSGQRNEHVLEENKEENHAECSGSINGGNDALSMHVAWDGPCDQLRH